MRVAFLLVAAAVGDVALSPAASGASGVAGTGAPGLDTVRRDAFLMGTRVTLVAVAADRSSGLRVLERLLAGLEGEEAELSTWRPDSLLAAVNRQPPATPQPAPEQLCALLEEIAGWHRVTGGAFDPAIGALVDAWGLRSGGRQPSAEEIDKARRRSGLDHLVVERHPCRITRRRPVTLDAGAFGKGAAVDRVADGDPVVRRATWMIDLGGQVTVHGDGEAWPVALAHPARRQQSVVELALRSGTLATSGGSERDAVVVGRRIGHVLDPRSGEPVTRAASVTVWHPRALTADVLSTALYVMGVEEGLAWAASRGIAACFLVPDDTGDEPAIRATEAFQRRFLSD